MNRIRLFIWTVLCLLFVLPLGHLISRSSGAPEGASGAIADQGTTCTSCHGGTASLANYFVSTNIPDSGYTLSATYFIRIQFWGEGAKGFQLSMQDAMGRKQGVLMPDANSRFAGTKYITHQFAQGTDTATWTLTWKAPDTSIGTVTLYGAYVLGRPNVYFSVHQFVESKSPMKAQVLSFSPTIQGNFQKVSIKGKNLQHVDSLYFSGVKAKSISIISDTLIEAIPDLGSAEQIIIYEDTFTNKIQGFTWVQPFKMIALSPDTLRPAQLLRIKGKDFRFINEVKNNNQKIGNFLVLNDSTIQINQHPLQSGYIKVTGIGGVDSLTGFVYEVPVGLAYRQQIAENILFVEGDFILLSGPPAHLKIYDMQGRECDQFILKDRHSLHGNLPAGQYIARTASNEYLRIYLD